jgi:hypothetical protein
MMHLFSRNAAGLAAACVTMFGVAPAQDGPIIPCPPGVLGICSYDCLPTSPPFVSIVGLPGTVVMPFPAGADDSAIAIPFPPGFTFDFYCVAQTGVNVCTNGFLNFGAIATTFTNQQVGDQATPNNGIFPWYDDLIFGAGSSIQYLFGPTTLTIQWTSMVNYSFPLVPAPTFSFQVVLHSGAGPIPNAIDFRYDRTSMPDFPPCLPGGALTSAPSATVGLEPSLTGPNAPLGSIDCTGRGGANEVFPPCDLRMTMFRRTEAVAGVTMAVVPQPPFCSIVGMAGTLMVPNTCTAGQPCTDDDNSAYTMGGFIPLPWKVNFAGRFFRGVNMNSNGVMGLGQASSFGTQSANGAFPLSTTNPDFQLAPFWDSLEGVGPGSGMYYRIDGAAGCRVATFEWFSMGLKVGATGDCVATPGSLVTFQVKIYEGSAGVQVMSTGVCPYDLVLPGIGNDRIEYWYSFGTFGAAAYTATIGWEDSTGATGAALAGAASPGFPAGMVVLTTCDTGQVRYYGSPSNSGAPGLGFPEMSTNCVAPIIGNPFALTLHGSSPGFSVMLIDLGGPLPGMKTPVPCGGIPFAPFGIAHVNIFSPALFTFFVGPTGPGCGVFPLPIPFAPGLVGLTLYAQWGVLAGVGTELTEAVKVVIGG